MRQSFEQCYIRLDISECSEAENKLNKHNLSVNQLSLVIFSLNSLSLSACVCVQKQLLNHGKLYVCFIDFKKAFDLIDGNTLWLILKKNGIRGKMYKAVKSIYEVVKARVRVGGDLTEGIHV